MDVRAVSRRRVLDLGAFVSAVVLACSLVTPATAAVTWTGTVLTLDPSEVGNPINAYGFIAGYLPAQGWLGSRPVAAVYDPVQRKTVSPPLGNVRSSSAADVNDAGVVVGEYVDPDLITLMIHWVWKIGSPKVSTFGTTYSSAESAAYAINNAGLVVGSADREEGYPNNPLMRAVSWDTRHSNPAPHELTPLDVDGRSGAVAVNNLGQMVGYAADAHGDTRPVLWSSQTAAPLDLGVLPGYDSGSANDINDRGVVVGESFRRSDPTMRQAWFWNPATRLLAALPSSSASSANAINKYGVVVGQDRDGALIWNTCTPRPKRLDGLAAYAVNQQEKTVVTVPALDALQRHITTGERLIRTGTC